MKARSNNNLAIRLTLAILFAIACRSITPSPKPTSLPTALATSTAVAKLLHFDNDLVAFDYPEGMRLFVSGDRAFVTYPFQHQLGGELVAGLADPKWMSSGTLFRSIGIFRHPIPPGSSLEKIVQDTYGQLYLQPAFVSADGPITFAGLSAYQKSYMVYSGEPAYDLRDIWVEKEGGIFRLSIWTYSSNPEDLAAFQAIADKFLSSLHIKDNLPPIRITPTPVPTPTPTPFPDSRLLHFENDIVSFDYLKGMTIFTAGDPASTCYPDIQLGGELVVGLGDPKFSSFETYFRSIRIFHLPMPSGSNLEKIMLEAYRQVETKYPLQPGVVEATGPVTVAGLTAFQKTYRVYSGEPAYELRDIWVEKDHELFILSVWTEYTNPEDFAAFQASAEVFLKSLDIK